MIIEATFVRSAASASDFPREGLAEIALVGRSNVGKSSLINALVRQRVARTSAAPGKTRLANVYRVARGGFEPLYLVDLPGYGYARAPRQARGGLSGAEGRRQAACEFETLTAAYFARAREDRLDHPACVSALLLVDARHPGLASDLAAWQWIRTSVDRTGIVASKIDKLSRVERLRAVKANEAAFEHPVLPVSASTGEGLDELWKLIEHLATPSRNNPRHRRPPLPHRKS